MVASKSTSVKTKPLAKHDQQSARVHACEENLDHEEDIPESVTPKTKTPPATGRHDHQHTQVGVHAQAVHNREESLDHDKDIPDEDKSVNQEQDDVAEEDGEVSLHIT